MHKIRSLSVRSYYMRTKFLVLLLFIALGTEAQTSFTIDPTRDTILQSERGTRLSIPAGSFQRNDSLLTDSLTLLLTEATRPSEFLEHELHTAGQQGPLISSGMYRVVPANKQIELTPGSSLALSVTQTVQHDSTAVYRQEEDQLWQSTQIPLVTIDSCPGAQPIVRTNYQNAIEIDRSEHRRRKRAAQQGGPAYQEQNTERLFGGRSVDIALRFPPRIRIPRKRFYLFQKDTIGYRCPPDDPFDQRFEIERFGWYNLDRNFPDVQFQSLEVRTKYQSFRCVLLFPGTNTVLSGVRFEEGFRFVRVPNDRRMVVYLYEAGSEVTDLRVERRTLPAGTTAVEMNAPSLVSKNQFRRRIDELTLRAR